MATIKIIPNGTTNTGSYNFTLRNIGNAYYDSTHASGTYARLTLSANNRTARTSEIFFEFNKTSIENIPAGSTIDSITCNVKYSVPNTTYVTAVSLQLYSNNTPKGNQINDRNTTAQVYSITPGTWSLAELLSIRLHLSATHNLSNSNAYIYFNGADVNITYTEPSGDKGYLKIGNNWVELQKIHKKVNGSWVEQTDLTNLFQDGTIYVNG